MEVLFTYISPTLLRLLVYLRHKSSKFSGNIKKKNTFFCLSLFFLYICTLETEYYASNQTRTKSFIEELVQHQMVGTMDNVSLHSIKPMC